MVLNRAKHSHDTPSLWWVMSCSLLFSDNRE
jgi:hypothetical protein